MEKPLHIRMGRHSGWARYNVLVAAAPVLLKVGNTSDGIIPPMMGVGTRSRRAPVGKHGLIKLRGIHTLIRMRRARGEADLNPKRKSPPRISLGMYRDCVYLWPNRTTNMSRRTLPTEGNGKLKQSV